MDDEELTAEQIPEGPTEEPQAPEPEVSPPKVETVDVDERIDKRLGELERRLVGQQETQLAELMSRLKQSQRDSIDARSKQNYVKLAGVIDELVKSGDLDENKAMLHKAQLRDRVDAESLREAQETVVREPQPKPSDRWQRAWHDAMEEYELDYGDPEYKELRDTFQVDPRTDLDTAVGQARRAIRKAAKNKETRLAKATAEAVRLQAAKKAEAQKKAVSVDTGTGGLAPVPATLEQMQSELDKLIDAPEVRDPARYRAWEKRVDELTQAIQKATGIK